MRIEPAEGGMVLTDCVEDCGRPVICTPDRIGVQRCPQCERRHLADAVRRAATSGTTIVVRPASQVGTDHPSVPANARRLAQDAEVVTAVARRRLESVAAVSAWLSATVTGDAESVEHLTVRWRAGRALRGWFGWSAGKPTGGQFLRADGSIATVGFTLARAILAGTAPIPAARPYVEKPKIRAAVVAPPRYGVWLIAGTPADRPYPCRCYEGRDRWACEHGRCPCWGRDDVVNLRAGCCAFGWLAQQTAWRGIVAPYGAG